jgi:hypothetical protein
MGMQVPPSGTGGRGEARVGSASCASRREMSWAAARTSAAKRSRVASSMRYEGPPTLTPPTTSPSASKTGAPTPRADASKSSSEWRGRARGSRRARRGARPVAVGALGEGGQRVEARDHRVALGLGQPGEHRLGHGAGVQRQRAAEDRHQAHALRALAPVDAHGAVAAAHEQVDGLAGLGAEAVEDGSGDVDHGGAVEAHGGRAEAGGGRPELEAGVVGGDEEARGLEGLERAVRLVALEPELGVTSASPSRCGRRVKARSTSSVRSADAIT